MANALQPTAANIISSLGIKGATVSENLPGYVPVLDATGHLNAKFIPANAEQYAIQPLSDVAFVDPYTTVGFDSEGTDVDTDPENMIRIGSIAAPFKSVTEAASRYAPTDAALAGKYAAFMLAPGKYDDGEIAFPSARMPLSLYILGLGECTFSSGIAVYGMSSAVSGRNPSVFLQGIYTTSSVTIAASAGVTVVGKSYISTLNAQSGSSLLLSSDSRVDSTNIQTVAYSSESRRIGYERRSVSDPAFPEGTAANELDRLRWRKVRITNVTGGSSGLIVDSAASYADITAGSSSGLDVFDMRQRDRVFIDAINSLFAKSKNASFSTVNADVVNADTVNVTGELKMNSVLLGGYRLTVDAYGYLVVLDGSGNPPSPPSSVFLIRDSVTGAIYMLGVADGRMYIADANIDSSDSSSFDDSIPFDDSETSASYIVTVQNGRITVTRQSA